MLPSADGMQCSNAVAVMQERQPPGRCTRRERSGLGEAEFVARVGEPGAVDAVAVAGRDDELKES